MAFWADQPELLAGRDLLQGGTWLGLNRSGLFTTVTNYRDGRRQDPDTLLSRGNLTRDYLERTKSATEYLQQLQPELYGGYNLLVGDSSGLYHHSNRGHSSGKLSAGVYGLSNALLDTPWPKLERVKSGLNRLIQNRKPDIDQLLSLMQDPEQAADKTLPDTGISYDWEKKLSSPFIQSDSYGTRATTLLLQRPDGQTRVIEQSYDQQGATTLVEFELQLTPIG